MTLDKSFLTTARAKAASTAIGLGLLFHNCRTNSIRSRSVVSSILGIQPFKASNGSTLNSFEKATLMAPAGSGGMMQHPSHISWLVDHIDFLSRSRTDSSPLLYMDAEGVNLGRNGTISILQVLIAPLKETYLLDVHTLGSATFNTPGISGKTLKDLLESSNITTGWFDLRADANALFYLHGVKLNVCAASDMQVMNSAYWHESGNKQSRVWGLDKTIGFWIGDSLSQEQSSEFYSVKSQGKAIFANGEYERFNERPLPLELVKYCTQDVALLPDLHSTLMNALDGLAEPENVMLNVTEVTIARGLLAMSDSFTQGKHNSFAPWSAIWPCAFAGYDSMTHGAHSWIEPAWKEAQRREQRQKWLKVDWEHYYDSLKSDGCDFTSPEDRRDTVPADYKGYSDVEYELAEGTWRGGEYVTLSKRYEERNYSPYWLYEHEQQLREQKQERAEREKKFMLDELPTSGWYDHICMLEEDWETEEEDVDEVWHTKEWYDEFYAPYWDWRDNGVDETLGV